MFAGSSIQNPACGIGTDSECQNPFDLQATHLVAALPALGASPFNDSTNCIKVEANRSLKCHAWDFPLLGPLVNSGWRDTVESGDYGGFNEHLVLMPARRIVRIHDEEQPGSERFGTLARVAWSFETCSLPRARLASQSERFT